MIRITTQRSAIIALVLLDSSRLYPVLAQPSGKQDSLKIQTVLSSLLESTYCVEIRAKVRNLYNLFTNAVIDCLVGRHQTIEAWPKFGKLHCEVLKMFQRLWLLLKSKLSDDHASLSTNAPTHHLMTHIIMIKEVNAKIYNNHTHKVWSIDWLILKSFLKECLQFSFELNRAILGSMHAMEWEQLSTPSIIHHMCAMRRRSADAYLQAKAKSGDKSRDRPD